MSTADPCAITPSITTLTFGNHTITADYSGDVGFNSSTAKLLPDPPDRRSQESNHDDGYIFAEIRRTLDSRLPSRPTLRLCLANSDGHRAVLDGISGSIALGTPQPVNGSGDATVSTSALSAGTHNPITRDYSGDNAFLASSGTESHVVNACAATVVVDSIGDSGGAGTELREAIGLVCDGGTVTFDTAGVFATPQTITLTSGELLIGKNVTITGTGAANLTSAAAM